MCIRDRAVAAAVVAEAAVAAAATAAVAGGLAVVAAAVAVPPLTVAVVLVDAVVVVEALVEWPVVAVVGGDEFVPVQLAPSVQSDQEKLGGNPLCRALEDKKPEPSKKYHCPKKNSSQLCF